MSYKAPLGIDKVRTVRCLYNRGGDYDRPVLSLPEEAL